MTESEHEKARRLKHLRQQRRLQRERTGDTSNAQAGRDKEHETVGSGAAKRRMGDGVFWS